MEVYKEKFGRKDNQTVYSYTIKNDNGLELSCINYGGIITKILVPDRDGNIENIVLGFDTIEEYDKHSQFFGAIIGRFAGRIKGGRLNLNDQDYKLSQNENKNHLHGGFKGFSTVFWDSKIIEKENEITILLSYLSPDGEEGYPGNLNMNVSYSLNNKNELKITYNGISDKKTIVNLTNHSYFNLSGDLKRDILDHNLMINSSKYIEVTNDLVPSGNIVDVEETEFDFQKGRKVKDGVSSSHQQNIIVQNGYDHPFILNENHNGEIVLVDYYSGRRLMVETDEPCVVLYTGNKLEGSYSIRGVKSQNYLGLCLETQGPPDSIHHPHFNYSILEAGKEYKTSTKYSFGVLM